MARIIEMPKLSDTMEEGGVASWLKTEGEFIEDGEAIVEIETDKATMEYNSPEEGVLLKILVSAGESCALNAPIAVVGEKNESFDLKQLTSTAGADHATKSKVEPELDVVSEVRKPAANADSGDMRIKASPLAKKVAGDLGIDIRSVVGSGPGGRVVVKDVENLKSPTNRATTPHEAPSVITREAESPKATVASDMEGDELIPLTMMRKTIAKRLLAGKNEAPHFYLTRSVNMAKLLQWRKSLNKEAEASNGKIPKVSVNDCIVLATSRALVKHPEVNASWQGDHIKRFSKAHIAVAVALPEGLVTPVVRNADRRGVRDIAEQTKSLVAKAREGNLAPDEYQGGTFTVSNLGMMGIEEFTAIINPPQAAILALGSTIKTPWVNENDQVVIEQRMKMTMSCDHRVVDGAMGAGFLETLAQFIENPMNILA